jgi:hypothetical protein
VRKRVRAVAAQNRLARKTQNEIEKRGASFIPVLD